MNDTNPNVTLKQQLLNVPNRISAARLLLSFVVFALIPMQQYVAALIVFVIAAGTDWVDGWYARKYNLVTKLGRVLDPFCDKILICGTYILLAVEMNGIFPWYATIAGWMAVVVSGRELLVTVLRSMIEGAGGDFSAKWAGKLKMGFQCVAVGAALVALAYIATDRINTDGPESVGIKSIPGWVMVTLTIFVWASVVSTIYSGWLYVFGALDFLTDSDTSVSRDGTD